MRLLFCVSFDGTNYCGWQVQKNGISVQETVQNALEMVFKERVNVVSCSRTDSGVHAYKFFFHCDVNLNLNFSVAGIKMAVNCCLPKDVVVLDVKEVSGNFHARYSAKNKEYCYQIWNSRLRNPFLEKYAWHIFVKLNLEKIKKGGEILIGEHDFTSFCSTATKQQNRVRKLEKFEIEQQGNLIVLRLVGNGFLHNMVRIIVGTLVGVSEGKFTVESLKTILKGSDRKLAGKTAPACGLFLKDVTY